ncbi:MAG: right-handed parallel beta-helix repeat-containing protein [PVC group bacterium]
MKRVRLPVLILLPGLWVLFAAFPSPSPCRTIPPLSEILAASEYLAAGDIPEDTTTAAGKTPLYVATDGADSNSGLSLASPKQHLGAAIEYANANPSLPFVIYLRGGVHYRSSAYEYLEIERGDLMITAYPGEEVIIRPDIWPANPSSWGEEVLLYSYSPCRNITISDLTLEGWSTPFVFGTQFNQPPLENLVIKNIRAREFRKRGSGFITQLFSTNYVSAGYFSGREFDPDDPGIKYQIEGLIFSGVRIEDVDMPINIGDEDDANVKGVRISGVEVRNDPQEDGSTAVDGFAVVNCRNVLIDNCLIENIQGDGIDTKSFGVCVVNTLLSGIGRNGVKFWHDGEVINSIIYEADADAAFVIEDGPCRMINSILMKKGEGYCGTYAYDGGSAEKFEAVNSIFIDLDHTFYLGTPDLRSLNSLYYDMPAGLYSGQVSASTVTGLNGLAACSGNIAADPLLVSAPEEDFRASYGSPCRDRGTAAGVLLPSFDYYGNPRSAGGGPDIGPVETSEPVLAGPADYDGDGDSDIAVFRDPLGLWAVRGVTRRYFGGPADIPAPADYTGDGIAGIAFYRRLSGLWAVRGVSRFSFGTVNDLPLPADYDGDGIADPALFRESSGLWAVRGVSRFYFGRAGDRPVPGDFNGDGSTDCGIFRETSGLWAVRGVSRFYYGGPGDRPAPGDFDGDGTADPGIFRESSGLWAARGVSRFYFGRAGDRPTPGDYDGDGTADPGIFRESSGLWAVRGVSRLYFGTAGDEPVAR